MKTLAALLAAVIAALFGVPADAAVMPVGVSSPSVCGYYRAHYDAPSSCATSDRGPPTTSRDGDVPAGQRADNPGLYGSRGMRMSRWSWKLSVGDFLLLHRMFRL